MCAAKVEKMTGLPNGENLPGHSYVLPVQKKSLANERNGHQIRLLVLQNGLFLEQIPGR